MGMEEVDIVFEVVGKCFCSGKIIESRGKDVIRFCEKCNRDYKVK